jgi:hypothetical protein
MKSLIQRMTDIENNKTSQLNESVVAECGMAGSMTPPPAPPSMSINLSAQGLGQIQELLGLMKNAGLEKAAVVSQDMMPVRQDMERLRSIVDGPEMEADAAYSDVITDDEETEESFANEPDEEYQDHEYMIHDLSGGINKPKRMYPAAQRGDNAMAVENIKTRLQKALAEKKSKPDFLDMDKDGNKKEPMKKAVADKKKESVKEGVAISPTFIKHLQMTFGDKAQLSRSEMLKVKDMLNKLSIENIKTLMSANIPHVSQMAKLYLRNKTPGGMVKYKEAEVQTPTHELDDTARKAMNIAQMIKRKINSGEKMDDMDYNQMAELGHVLSRFGTNFGPKSMKDVMNHMVQYTNDRNEYGTGYPEFNVDRFKELIAMAK